MHCGTVQFGVKLSLKNMIAQSDSGSIIQSQIHPSKEQIVNTYQKVSLIRAVKTNVLEEENTNYTVSPETIL